MGIMRVSSSYVRDELVKIWPDLDMVILLDKEFIIPELKEVVELFKESKIREMQSIGEFNDCDDFALFFMAEIRKKRYDKLMSGNLPSEEMAPWALGRAVGNMFRGAEMNHVVNLCLVKEGIYLFDIMPDSDRYWKAESGNDNVVLFEI